MEVNVLQYLSEDEIKEICKDEIRMKIRESFREKDIARIVSNSAYYKAYDLVDEHITKEHRDTIVESVDKIINDSKSYNVFRYHYMTNKPESIASQIVENTVESRKQDMIDKINSVITNTLNEENEEVYQTFVERFMDNMWNGFTVKFDK